MSARELARDIAKYSRYGPGADYSLDEDVSLGRTSNINSHFGNASMGRIGSFEYGKAPQVSFSKTNAGVTPDWSADSNGLPQYARFAPEWQQAYRQGYRDGRADEKKEMNYTNYPPVYWGGTGGPVTAGTVSVDPRTSIMGTPTGGLSYAVNEIDQHHPGVAC